MTSFSQYFEVNFDGIVGPTHHYGGLGSGNLASQHHALKVAYPRQAALQGLDKMKSLASRGIRQAVIPPIWRRVLYPEFAPVFSKELSASSMWVANAGTISPSLDTVNPLLGKNKIHITPANLKSQYHRSLELPWTTQLLKQIFKGDAYVHHEAVSVPDEGAANHTRLFTKADARSGLEIFTYGYSELESPSTQWKYPPRQSLEASQQIAQQHGLQNVLFVRQTVEAINAGVFHNDVIAVGHEHLLFIHEKAWEDQAKHLKNLRQQGYGVEEVLETQVSLKDAVQSYLFNSQIVTLPSGDFMLLTPQECFENTAVKHYLQDLIQSKRTAIREWLPMDLRQSMQNGGGPACLRLRVYLNEEEWSQVHEGVKWTPALDAQLRQWIGDYYPEEQTLESLLQQDYGPAFEALETIIRFPRGFFSGG
jgi:succinylarginine dihydrolase